MHRHILTPYRHILTPYRHILTQLHYVLTTSHHILTPRRHVLSVLMAVCVCLTARAQTNGEGTYHFESHGNPIVRHMYTSDPAPYVEGDTLWLFTGHDASGDNKDYVMPDWALFSTTDMRHWTQHPRPLSVDDFAWADSHQAYAGQVVKRGGKYYFYISTNWSGIGVAVADRVTGPYKDALGRPLLTSKDCFDSKHSWAVIDPTVFIDDDGTPYLAWGNGQCYIVRLKDNMIETDGPIRRIHLSDTHRYTEGPWLHKHDGHYYLTFASGFPEVIAYAMADNIWGPYETKGVISGLAPNSTTTHPGIVEFKGRWLFFTHNGALPGGSGYNRSVIAEPMDYRPDGTIVPIPATDEGVPAL